MNNPTHTIYVNQKQKLVVRNITQIKDGKIKTVRVLQCVDYCPVIKNYGFFTVRVLDSNLPIPNGFKRVEVANPLELAKKLV